MKTLSLSTSKPSRSNVRRLRSWAWVSRTRVCSRYRTGAHSSPGRDTVVNDDAASGAVVLSLEPAMVDGRDLRRNPALHRRALQGVGLDPCRNHPGTRPIRPPHQTRSAQEGHLDPAPPKRLAANSKPVTSSRRRYHVTERKPTRGPRGATRCIDSAYGMLTVEGWSRAWAKKNPAILLE